VELLRKPLRYAYARLGRRYVRVALTGQILLAHLVTLGGIALLTLYQRMSTAHLLEIIAVSQALVVVENALALSLTFRLVRPADPWLVGERGPDAARTAWRALAGLPVDFLRHRRGLAVFMNVVPISLFITLLLELPAYSFAVLLAGASIVLVYGATVRFFATEMILRPVLEAISRDLPEGVAPVAAGVPLQVKLLAVLPAINVITGVVVSALSRGGDAHLTDLGTSVLAALAVAFTISFELTVLLSRSLLEPIKDLHTATQRVAAGDFSVRVPVVATDETGALAGSFNRMVAGLRERRRLHEAFAAFVDPVLADRVIEDGSVFEGEELDVSVLFVDIRDFTALAERSSAADVVGILNEFYERIVPLLVRHGGHANKFIGDGLLGVFGAPARRADHADRAVAAALEIAALVRAEYGGRLRIGIGVNSGPVVAGTVGGGGKLEFTVIGDAVNTASRVERATRQTGDDVLITDATHRLLTRRHGGFEPRPNVSLKGKSAPVVLYAPLHVGAGEGRRLRRRRTSDGHDVARGRETGSHSR
jgi:adenylate cyclase